MQGMIVWALRLLLLTAKYKKNTLSIFAAIPIMNTTIPFQPTSANKLHPPRSHNLPHALTNGTVCDGPYLPSPPVRACKGKGGAA